MQRAPLSLPLTRTPSCPETGLLGSSGSFGRTPSWLGWVVSIVFIPGLPSSKLSFQEPHIGSGVSTEESQVDGAYLVAIWLFRRRLLLRWVASTPTCICTRMRILPSAYEPLARSP